MHTSVSHRGRCVRVASARSIRRPSGFTVIELMFVLAILSVLMVLAIVAYQDYTKRTRMLEVMLAAGTCRNPVFEKYYEGKPVAAGQWGCEHVGGWSDYVDSIAVDDNGKVLVTARGFGDDDIDGQVLTLTPMDGGDPAVLADDKGKTLGWRCGASGDGTTIAAKYLPSACRAQP